MRRQNQIFIVKVFLHVFILSFLGPFCTEAAVKTGPEFLVNTWFFYDQGGASVTGLSGGGFVVTWHSYQVDTSDRGVAGQMVFSLVIGISY